MSKRIKVTGVGSRYDLPAHIKQTQIDIGYKIASKGWELRSGGAVGSDKNHYKGVCNFLDEYLLKNIPPDGDFITICPPALASIYLPEDGYENNYWMDSRFKHFIDTSNFANLIKAEELAKGVHDHWSKCNAYARKLHTRNAYQILGDYLNNPSDIMFFYAEPLKGDKVKGGTNTAYQLAKKFEVPYIFNIYKDEDYEKVLKWLKKT